MGDSGDALIGKRGDRTLGQRNVVGDGYPDQDVAGVVPVELDVRHLADSNAAIAYLCLGIEAADTVFGDHNIVTQIFLRAAQPEKRKDCRCTEDKSEQTGDEGMRLVFHGRILQQP